MRADWQRHSPGHFYFLTTFLSARPPDLLPPGPDWRLVLGEDPGVATDKFLKAGAVTRAGLVDCLAFKFDVAALAQMCGERGLPTTGERADLALRLVQAEAEWAKGAVDDLILLKCTDNGRIVAEAYLADGCPGLVERVQVSPEQSKQVARWLLGGVTIGVLGNAAWEGLKRLAGEWTASAAELPISPAPPPAQLPPQPVPTPRPAAQPGTPEAPRAGHGSLRFDWVTIPAGSFLMGSDKRVDKQASDNEAPQHSVYLPSYRIARVPVTVAQFATFMAANPGYHTTAEAEGSAWNWTGSEWKAIKGADWAHPRGPKSDVRDKQDHPVTCVSWHDALAFCRWAGVRLPTEVEWEKAARGTDGRIWPWGNREPNSGVCNFNMPVGDTTSVGRYPDGKSPYGLLDVAGNVWEWTSSLWGKDFPNPDYGYPYNPSDGRENQGAPNTVRRVLRGGSFWGGAQRVRCACRLWSYPDDRRVNFGFRVVSPGF